MEKYNCLILEDEPLAAEIIQDYIGQVPFLTGGRICRDAIYALEALQQEQVDVLFLDLHLPKLKGFDFLKTLQQPPQVIVTTAYREYAIEGFELNVVDYLLKPISFQRFLAAVNKLKKAGTASVQPAAIAPAEPAHLLINVNKKKIRVPTAAIQYIESLKEYAQIVTEEQTYKTRITLTEIEEQLQPQGFLRVHRSYMVAKDKITAWTAAGVEVGGHKIPIGRSYQPAVQTALKDR